MRFGLKTFQQIPRRIIMTTARMAMKARKTVLGSVDAIVVLYFCIFLHASVSNLRMPTAACFRST
jgi:hypothetical protein